MPSGFRHLVRTSLLLLMMMISAAPLSALQIQLRYELDTSGFFNRPEARAAIQAVADYYASLLSDPLLSIDTAEWPAGNSWSATFEHPSTGAFTSIKNLVVPANTLVVFVGARPLGPVAAIGGPGGYSLAGSSQAWFQRVASRGQPGALASPKTDFAPWGGTMTFDTARTWNYSQSVPSLSQLTFVTVALHEFGHLLGIGTSDSWDAKVSGLTFTGSASRAAYGSAVPLQTGGFHWRDDGRCALPNGYISSEPKNVLSKAFGAFGAPHGFPQIALMDPSTCSAGQYLKVMTDLDLAALRDVGWQVEPPLKVQATPLVATASAVTLSWPSTSGVIYRVQESPSLFQPNWGTVSSQTGNGGVLSYTKPLTPQSGRGFFRLDTGSAPGLSAPVVTLPPPMEMPPRIVTDCHCGDAWGIEESIDANASH